MIISFANKRLDVNAEEKEYLNKLKESLGEGTFIGLFESDQTGCITSISPSPSKPIQLIVLFYLLNLMLNQRLRKIDNSRIESLEKRIAELETKLGIINE